MIAIPVFLLAFIGQVAVAEEVAPRTLAVVVTDSKGVRIHGLTAADFQLLENGQSKEIKRFSESTAETGSEVRRSIVILFDSSTLSLGARKKSVAALRTAAAALIRPQDRIAVATITPTGGMLEAVAWTNDLAAVTKALDMVEREVVTPSFTSADRTEQEIRQLIIDDRNGGNRSQITFDTLLSPARQYAEFVTLQARHILDGVTDAVEYTGAGPGRKAVLLVGAGLPSRPGAGIFQFLESVRDDALTGNLGAGVRRGAATASPMSEGARYDMTSHINDVGRAAFRRGVVVYAIDGEGWRGDSTVERTNARDIGMEGATSIEKLAGYQLLANASGGAALFGSSAPDAFAQIATDLQA
ncbi:MAG: VWA domain-containing protein, partial [Thermoanaerobaculia bacterium]